MNIVIVGTGYVGLVTGVGFAEQGHTVSFIDLDSSIEQDEGINVEVTNDISLEHNSHNSKITIISDERDEKLKKIDTKNQEHRQ